MQKNSTAISEFSEPQSPTVQLPPTASKKSVSAKAALEAKPVKIAQATVGTSCPYCNHKQELPFEKGKNGKPFFTACPRCSSEFAVRFVPVTMYQAQVAAFK